MSRLLTFNTLLLLLLVFCKTEKSDFSKQIAFLGYLVNESDCRNYASEYSTDLTTYLCSFDKSKISLYCNVNSPPKTGAYKNAENIVERRYDSVADFVDERQFVKLTRYTQHTCTGDCM
ncbi:MAG TPA: hypothetical protein PL169_22175 [Leptospiraceae bacterium]|nr:hypothetical protein [Leptospiraceae bacterium]